MRNLSLEQRAALNAIILAPVAWISVSTLRSQGHESALAELLELDLVVVWDLPGDPAVTLTVWGAWLSGVEIDERFETHDGVTVEVPFWVGYGNVSPAVVLPRHAREVRLPVPEWVPDPAPGPEYLVDEESGREVRLFAGLDGKGEGVQVKIDPRLGKRPKKRPKRAG